MGRVSEPSMTSRSVWQKPLARMRTSTSCGCSGPDSTCATRSGVRGASRTAALNFIGARAAKVSVAAAVDAAAAAHHLLVIGDCLRIELAGRRLFQDEVTVLVRPAHQRGGI